MTHDAQTALNPSESPFDLSLSRDGMTRPLDQRMIDAIDVNDRRGREHSKRLMRLESTLEHTHSTLQLLEKNQQAWLETHEQAATAIGAIANRLDVHASMEEVQWDVVNKSNERIENLSAVLGQHLEGSGAVVSRIDNLEKILWSVVGALVSATFGTIGYLVTLLK